jgi:membrane associated rhomboid family serine protease
LLILPVVEGLNWRRPPPVTLLLILANVLVFFVYQSGDAARGRRAAEAYFASSLPAIELPLFVAHVREARPELAQRLEPVAAAVLERKDDPGPAGAMLLAALENDAEFRKALRESRVVTAQHPAYARWREDRARVDALFAELSFRRFGFLPADPKPETWLTHMFLHGDLMHLLGNMAFLFIVGVAVESALGWWRYLGLYIAGGLAGVGLFFAVHAGSQVPLVGASGAISGLMGLFTVVFGLRKVNFFYWLLFVFGFRAMRGLVVLPVWIGWEVLQSIVDKQSNVGYMAHAGGLIGGALLGALVVRRFSGGRVERFHEEREQEAFDRGEYDRARALVAKLDFKGASQVFARLAERFPREEELLRQWHAVAKIDAASEHFHRAVALLLQLPRPAAPLRAFQRDAFLDYQSRARPAPRLPPESLARAALTFAKGGEIAVAERAAEALFKAAPSDRHLPVIWEQLARAFGEGEADVAKAKRYRALIGAAARVKPPG